MDASRIPPQAAYLYGEGWRFDVDHHFVSLLVHQKAERKWQAPEIPEDELRKAMDELNSLFDVKISWKTICKRGDMLYKRYKTFKGVLSFPGTFYDRKANVIRATKAMWKDIFELDAFAKAYYYEAKIEWRMLDRLFYVPHPNRDWFNSITLQMVKGYGELASDDEEVTSPEPISARLRLFVEHATSQDLHSTTKRATNTVSVSEAKGVNSSGQVPGRSPAASPASEKGCWSSCASSSPWWKK